MGSDLWALSGEIEKLVAFAGGQRIKEEDVKTMVGYGQQTTVFAMIDAILDFRAELAEQLLQRLLQSGSAPSQLLTLLARQVQFIVRARALKDRKANTADIQSKLGILQDFVFRKTLDQAGRFSNQRLVEVYHRILEADLAIKTGLYDPDLTLTMLVAEVGRKNAQLSHIA